MKKTTWFFLVEYMEKFLNINIIFEDNHLLVVEKPVNMPVCEDDSKDNDLLSTLKLYLKTKYNKPGNVYLGLVHRLDRPVGGVMVFAKTSKCASRLSKQISEHKFKKVYYAVVDNKTPSSGEFIDYLTKDSKNNISYVTDSNNGKYSKLYFNTIKYHDNYSLVEIHLMTGRSHQIRVQFSSRNYPLIGDVKYGSKFPMDKGIALFAAQLSFYHPISNESLTFKLDLPKRYPFNLF